MSKMIAKRNKKVAQLIREGWTKVGMVETADPTSEQFGSLWEKDGQTFLLNLYTLNGI